MGKDKREWLIIVLVLVLLVIFSGIPLSFLGGMPIYNSVLEMAHYDYGGEPISSAKSSVYYPSSDFAPEVEELFMMKRLN